MLWRYLQKTFDFFASLGLAVFVILALAVVLAAGTIIEAKYGANVASQLVYRGWWNQVLLWLLLINVTAAAVSRLPWKRHHIGFLVTHLGIIILLLGSFITQRFGVDGMLALDKKEPSRIIRIDEPLLNVFRAQSGSSYELLLSQPLEFHPLKGLKEPRKILLRGDATKVSVENFISKANRIVGAREATHSEGGVPAVRLRLEGSRAQFAEWMFLQGDINGTSRELGPARLRFQRTKPTLFPDKPTIFIYLNASQRPMLAVAKPRETKIAFLGEISLGKPVAVGWMDFSLILDDFKKSALPDIAYQPLPHSTPANAPGVTQAIELKFGDEKRWLELGSAVQFAQNNAIYYVQYTRKQVDIGFDLFLKEFKVEYYQGTNRAKSYASHVRYADQERIISMNEPLKEAGFTFYQSSFESDESGEPVLSVLSVNRDPGRWIKYLGSLLIVLGTLLLFYFKPQYSGKSKFLLKIKTTASSGENV